MNILQVCSLLVGCFAVSSFAFPTQSKDATKIEAAETNEVAVQNVYNNPTMLRDPKDLADLFTYLMEMRAKKSLSIIGKDSNYIYLMVSSNGIEEEGEESTAVGDVRRSKRSLFKKLGKGFDWVGPTGVRNIALTISLFNYLGYLPMRLPGVPYHIDTGSPDDNYYNPVNEFHHETFHY